VVWASNQGQQQVLCFDRLDTKALARKLGQLGGGFHVNWGKLSPGDKPRWAFKCRKALATAVCGNAVLVATESKLQALDLNNGDTLWVQPLPASPVPWGLAVDRAGRVIVTLEDGRVLCFGADERV